MVAHKHKVAIVTGAGKGIGKGLALNLAREGVDLVINDIDSDLLHSLSDQITDIGRRVTSIVGSAGDKACIQSMVDGALSTYGSLDIAIANAGITTFGSFLDYPVDHLEELLKVNLQGSFLLAQSAAKAMIRQDTKGRILMMSSVTGFQYHKDLVAYGMTKAAIKHLVKSLGVELAPHGITVNALAPGATITERTRKLDDDYEHIWESITPNGRAASIEDICAAAMYFLGDQAGHVTGQTLLIDGGWTAISPQP